MLGQQLDISFAIDLVQHVFDVNDGFHGQGIRESDLVKWAYQLKPNVVISCIDKNKTDLCFSCPLGWQTRVMDLAVKSKGFTWSAPTVDFVETQFEKIKDKMSYTGVTFHKHRVGAWTAWPKESGLETKMRPTGSYKKHGLKSLLSLTTRVMTFIMKQVIGDHARCSIRQKDWFVPVQSFQQVVENANRFNLNNQDLLRRGWSVESMSKKTDFDNFFVIFLKIWC